VTRLQLKLQAVSRAKSIKLILAPVILLRYSLYTYLPYFFELILLICKQKKNNGNNKGKIVLSADNGSIIGCNSVIPKVLLQVR
jgi:hypothetical protein